MRNDTTQIFLHVNLLFKNFMKFTLLFCVSFYLFATRRSMRMRLLGKWPITKTLAPTLPLMTGTLSMRVGAPLRQLWSPAPVQLAKLTPFPSRPKMLALSEARPMATRTAHFMRTISHWSSPLTQLGPNWAVPPA